MVNVITNRGIFNITNSLLEAIKKNNPLLLEAKKKDSYGYESLLLPKLSKYGFKDVKQITPILNKIAEKKPDILSNFNKTSDVIIKAIEKAKENKKIQNEPKQQSELVKDNSGQQILDAQKEKNKNVSGDLENSVTPEVKKEVDSEIKNKENNQENKEILSTKSENNRKSENNGKIDNTLKYMVENDYELHKQISSIEMLSSHIIKRIKYILHSQAGIMGSNTNATPSKFPEYDDEDLFSDNNFDPNNRTINHTMTNKSVNSMRSNSSPIRKGSSELKLAFGGFKITPFFGDLNSSVSGKALKYYASAQKDTKNSRIDEMIRTLIKLKTNPELFDKEDLDNYQKPFEQMAYRFLHNVVYNLLINNETHYDEMLRIIRNDNVLKDMFNISYLNIQQQLNARENIMYFENLENGTIDLLLIISPLLAKGRKIIDNLKPIWNLGNQAKV